jgi:hypothetical protein
VGAVCKRETSPRARAAGTACTSTPPLIPTAIAQPIPPSKTSQRQVPRDPPSGRQGRRPHQPLLPVPRQVGRHVWILTLSSRPPLPLPLLPQQPTNLNNPNTPPKKNNSRYSRFNTGRVRRAAQRYAEIADECGLSPAQLAYAWAASRPFVGSTIVGAFRGEGGRKGARARGVSDSQHLKHKPTSNTPHECERTRRRHRLRAAGQQPIVHGRGVGGGRPERDRPGAPAEKEPEPGGLTRHADPRPGPVI